MRLIFLLLLLSSSGFAQLCDPNTNSIHFNGNSYVSFPSNSNLNITAKITVEAWIKVSSFSPDYVQGSIVCKHGWSSGEKGFVLRAGGNGIAAFAIAGIDDHGNAEGWIEAKSDPGDLQLNTWHHVAGTYDGNKIKLFVDGNQVRSVSFKGSIAPSTNYDLKIGRIADNNTSDKRFFSGNIDEVRIWNDDLPRATIEANMETQISPLSPHLVAYWEMNDGSGTTVTDLGSAGCNGTMISTQWDTDVPFTNGIPRPHITSLGNALISSSLTGNQWNLNGMPIVGETGISITPVTGGNYTVTSNYGLGCIATSEVYRVVFTGIENLLSKQLSIATLSEGIYQIVSTGNQLKNSQLNIYSFNGSLIYSSSNPFSPINLTNTAAGIYFFSISFEGQEWRIKIIR